ncbi:hypothetical protein [Leptospira weilii]|uniref:hypothetical protein n=1 Tax=Leptospira weilii TaxID=28184 RepID=UPI00138EFFF8|nr:hypothetical protein [Leptospira weilii]
MSEFRRIYLRIQVLVGKVMAVTPTQLGIQGAIPQNFKFLEKGIITILERNLI